VSGWTETAGPRSTSLRAGSPLRYASVGMTLLFEGSIPRFLATGGTCCSAQLGDPNPESCSCSKPSRNSEQISLSHGGGSLLSLEAIEHGEHFDAAHGGIAAHGVVVHRHGE
jgi:hypothetical protein